MATQVRGSGRWGRGGRERGGVSDEEERMIQTILTIEF
jgi:hypothetical protein